jgi:hypothetical protein
MRFTLVLLSVLFLTATLLGSAGAAVLVPTEDASLLVGGHPWCWVEDDRCDRVSCRFTPCLGCFGVSDFQQYCQQSGSGGDDCQPMAYPLNCGNAFVGGTCSGWPFYYCTFSSGTYTGEKCPRHAVDTTMYDECN